MIDAAFVNRWCRTPATLVLREASETERDEMNNPVVTPTTRRVLVLLWPGDGIEDLNRRDVNTSRFTAFFKACDEPDPTAALTVSSTTYEFDGPPKEWLTPDGCRIAWEARLVRAV